jgi:hypothetical protein
MLRVIVGVLVLSMEAMAATTRPPLVLLMELKAKALGLEGWPLAHSLILEAPGRSWPEVLGCTAHEYNAEVNKLSTNRLTLRNKGLFVTRMSMLIRRKKLKFSTVKEPLGDDDLVEKYVYGELPDLYVEHLDAIMDEGRFSC